MAAKLDFITLSGADLAGLEIGTQDVAQAIESAVRAKARGKLWDAPKAVVLPDDGRYVMATLAVSDDPSVVVVKSVLLNPENPARGLPGINGAVLVLDAQSGVLRAVIDANWVTAVRTAGLSAVMARRLANPDAQIVTFVGSGVQAHAHLDAFSSLFPLSEVRVLGRGQANIDKLCAAAAKRGMRAKGFGDAQTALAGADIIVSAITLSFDIEPFLDARWLKPGAFATVTDLAVPWVPAGHSAFTQLYVGDREQEAAMEKPMVDARLITGDLQSAVTGASSPRFDADGRAAFVFRGLALGDLAIAGLAYQRATGG